MDIAERAYNFSVRVAELVRYLKEEGKNFPLDGKLLDCAVTAGIYAREGRHNAAAGQLRQADYIIEMAARSGYLTELQTGPIREEGRTLLQLLKPKAFRRKKITEDEARHE